METDAAQRLGLKQEGRGGCCHLGALAAVAWLARGSEGSLLPQFLLSFWLWGRPCVFGGPRGGRVTGTFSFGKGLGLRRTPACRPRVPCPQDAPVTQQPSCRVQGWLV